MEKVEAGTILKVKTGKYDANHAKENGNYQFFTCALVPFWTDTYSFDDEVIILPGNGANVGEVLYYKGKLEAYQRTYILYEINANVRYLYYYFKKYWIRQITKKQVGSATNYIKMDDILSFEIPLPSIATQQRIAAILDQADAIIQNNRAIVQKYDALTQSLFLEMFGDPVKNEKGWEVDNLSIVAPFKKFDGKIKNVNGNYWLLNLDMIEQQTGKIIEMKYVSENEINTSTISFSENQVLYSKLRPYLNKVLIPYQSGFGTSELVPMNPKVGVIDKFFLAHLLRTNNFVNYINDKVAGAKMPRVNMDTLRDFETILPPITLQNQFAERVAVIEAQKQQAQLALAKSEELFQSLLQRAFKGEL